MASPARATLMFSPSEDRPSVRSLESVGAVAVLEAMVEQRRQSSIPPPPPAMADFGDDAMEEFDEASPDESGPRPRVERKSLGFLKIR